MKLGVKSSRSRNSDVHIVFGQVVDGVVDVPGLRLGDDLRNDELWRDLSPVSLDLFGQNAREKYDLKNKVCDLTPREQICKSREFPFPGNLPCLIKYFFYKKIGFSGYQSRYSTRKSANFIMRSNSRIHHISLLERACLTRCNPSVSLDCDQ